MIALIEERKGVMLDEMIECLSAELQVKDQSQRTWRLEKRPWMEH